MCPREESAKSEQRWIRKKRGKKGEKKKPRKEDATICGWDGKKGEKEGGKKGGKSIIANLSNFPSVRESEAISRQPFVSAENKNTG